MKQYHITVDNQTFDVEILDDPRKSEVRVKVDGEEMVVKVEQGTPGPVAPVPAVPAIQRPVTAQPAAAAAQPASEPEAPSGAGYVLKAPLPGVVVSIAVQPGQTVTFNQELLVIEAMKAMNIIRAPKAGKIGAISVTEGKKIAYGASLLTIE